MPVTFTSDLSVIMNQSALACEASFNNSDLDGGLAKLAGKFSNQIADFRRLCATGRIQGGDVQGYELSNRRPHFLFIGAGYRLAQAANGSAATIADGNWPVLFLMNLSKMLVRERVPSCGLIGRFSDLSGSAREEFYGLVENHFRGHRSVLVVMERQETRNNDPRFCGYDSFSQAM